MMLMASYGGEREEGGGEAVRKFGPDSIGRGEEEGKREGGGSLTSVGHAKKRKEDAGPTFILYIQWRGGVVTDILQHPLK